MPIKHAVWKVGSPPCRYRDIQVNSVLRGIFITRATVDADSPLRTASTAVRRFS